MAESRYLKRYVDERTGRVVEAYGKLDACRKLGVSYHTGQIYVVNLTW